MKTMMIFAFSTILGSSMVVESFGSVFRPPTYPQQEGQYPPKPQEGSQVPVSSNHSQLYPHEGQYLPKPQEGSQAPVPSNHSQLYPQQQGQYLAKPQVGSQAPVPSNHSQSYPHGGQFPQKPQETLQFPKLPSSVGGMQTVNVIPQSPDTVVTAFPVASDRQPKHHLRWGYYWG